MQRDVEHTGPVNPVPPVVVALFLAIVLIEVAFYLGSKGLIGGPGAIGWRQAMAERYGFNGAILDWMMDNGRWPFEHVIRFVTYPFIHGGFTHAIFAGVMVLAIGKMVGEVFSSLATVLVFFASTIVGALAYGIILDERAWLIGAFPGVYGLIGAFTFLLWLRLGQMGARQVRAFSLIGFLLGIQLLFGLLFGGPSDWIADVAGFATGFLLSFVVSPGGWAKLRAKLRHG